MNARMATRYSSESRPQPAAFSVQHEQQALARQPEAPEGDTPRQKGQFYEHRHASRKPEPNELYAQCHALREQLQEKSQENTALQNERNRLETALEAMEGNMAEGQQRNDIQFQEDKAQEEIDVCPETPNPKIERYLEEEVPTLTETCRNLEDMAREVHAELCSKICQITEERQHLDNLLQTEREESIRTKAECNMPKAAVCEVSNQRDQIGEEQQRLKGVLLAEREENIRIQAECDNYKAAVGEVSNQRDQIAEERQHLDDLLQAECQEMKRIETECDNYKAAVGEVSNQRDQIAEEQERLNGLLRAQSQETIRVQAECDNYKAAVGEVSNQRDQIAEEQQRLMGLLLAESQDNIRVQAECDRYKAAVGEVSNQRDQIAEELQRLNGLLEAKSQEMKRIETECDKYKAAVGEVSNQRDHAFEHFPNTHLGIQMEVTRTMTSWVSEWAEQMSDLLGAPGLGLNRLLARVFLESEALVDRRRLQVYSFFLCGSDTPKTGIEMDEGTADFMLRHMRLHFEDMFPLKGADLETACDTIVNGVAEWMSDTLDCVTRDEAATLLEGPSPSLRTVIDKYLHVLVWANLQYPRTEFKDDCGQEQAFDPKVHEPSIDGAYLPPGDKCVVVFPAMQAEPSGKAYILPMDLGS